MAPIIECCNPSTLHSQPLRLLLSGSITIPIWDLLPAIASLYRVLDTLNREALTGHNGDMVKFVTFEQAPWCVSEPF